MQSSPARRAIWSRPRLLWAIIISTAIALATAVGGLAFSETANVRLSVPAQKVEASVTVTGGQTGRELVTQRIDATVTETQTGAASPVPVSASYAGGEVSLHYVCDTNYSNCWIGLALPTGIDVSTADGKHYVTTAATTFTAPVQDRIVPVRAVQPGAAGNTGPGTITTINGYTIPIGVLILKVSNPSAITGGIDGYTAYVVQQSDYDAVRTALAAKVTAELGPALSTKAAGMTFATTGPPTLTETSNHHVGDHAQTFMMTITGTQAAVAFSTSDATKLLHAALQQKVPAGYQLTSDPIKSSFEVGSVSPNADVTIKGVVSGWMARKVDKERLCGQIKGMGVSDARTYIQQAVPGSIVDIQLGPVGLPWMPALEKHISMTVTVAAPTQ